MDGVRTSCSRANCAADAAGCSRVPEIWVIRVQARGLTKRALGNIIIQFRRLRLYVGSVKHWTYYAVLDTQGGTYCAICLKASGGLFVRAADFRRQYFFRHIQPDFESSFELNCSISTIFEDNISVV